jgi:hypothetical protein
MLKIKACDAKSVFTTKTFHKKAMVSFDDVK